MEMQLRSTHAQIEFMGIYFSAEEKYIPLSRKQTMVVDLI